MRFAHSSMILMAALSASSLGCNEIVGARRYHVGDAGTQRPPDGSTHDASTRHDGSVGPPDAQIDASYCDPSERHMYYFDADGDGFGDESAGVEACAPPEGFAVEAGDCDNSVGTTYPGATEICDHSDSDCDGTIDEGVFGPVGTPIEVIPAGLAGPSYYSSVAAYSGGFLVVSGTYARWLDLTGTPTGDAFKYAIGSSSAGPTAAWVTESTSPPRGLIASSDSGTNWVVVYGYSADSTTTALGVLEPFSPAADALGVLQVGLVPVADKFALLGLYDSGSDEGYLLGGAIDPGTWRETGTGFDTTAINIDGAIPVSGSDGTLVSTSFVDGVSPAVALHWMRLDAAGTLSWDGTIAAMFDSPTQRVSLPRTDGLVSTDTIVVVSEDSSSVCLRHLPLGNPGEALTPTDCEAAVTWSVSDIATRDGVVAVVASDGTYQELPHEPGTTGRAAVTAIPAVGSQLAVRGGFGVITFAMSGALYAQPLGCE